MIRLKASDQAEGVAEGGQTTDPGQGQAFPGEQGTEQDRPDEVPDHRMLCLSNRLAGGAGLRDETR